MLYPKPKRVVNNALKERVARQPCAACGRQATATQYNDPHHIKSRKSGGGDIGANLLPLCRHDHTLLHKIGLNSFVKRYPRVEVELESKGWRYDEFREKWVGLD